MAASTERRAIGFKRFGGLRLDLPMDEVGPEQAIFLRDVDWDNSVGDLVPRGGFQKLKAAEATGEYEGIYPYSPTVLMAIKKISASNKKLVAISSAGAELGEITWTESAVKSTMARFGTPSASYVYARAAVSTHKPIRYDGTSFTTPTATVDGVAAKEMPRGAFMVAWPDGGNRLVVANTAATGGPNGAASSASHVWFSDPGNAESWHTVAPEANYAQLSPGDGEEITGMCVWSGMLFVFKQTQFFVFYSVTTDNEGAPEFNFRSIQLGDGSRIKRTETAALEETSDSICAATNEGVFFCTADGVYATKGGDATKISQALRPLEEGVVFLGPMAEFLNGSTEVCRWPAAGIVSFGRKLYVKRYEFIFVYDLDTQEWTCWRQNNVSLAVWGGVGGGIIGSLKAPTVVADTAGIGTSVWGTPENAKVADEAFAKTNVETGNKQTRYLKGSTFGFAIPSEATITGIQLSVLRKTAVASDVQDNAVRLVKAGVIGSTDRSSAAFWPTTNTTETYGGSTDMWGTTWTPAQINASGFGAAISAKLVGATSPSLCSVDYMELIVYYTLPGTPGSRPRLYCSNGKFIFYIGPETDDDGGKRNAEWQSGFYDLGSEDEKSLVETKLWGLGEVTFSSFKDMATVAGFSDLVDLGVSLTTGRSHQSQSGSLFSHRVKLADGSRLQRVVRYLRETATATKKSGTK